MGEDELAIDDLVIDDCIACNPSVDGSTIYQEHRINERNEERGEEDEKLENYKVLNAKAVVTMIFFTNVATLVIAPSCLVFTLPLSIALSFLISLLSGREKNREVDESKKIRGDEEWC